MSKLIEFVCVSSGNHDLYNAINTTFFSIYYLLDCPVIFHLITRNIDIQYAQSLIQNIEYFDKIRIHNENDFIIPTDEFKSKRKSGYKLQMLLKLKAHKIISSNFYITLDSDMYLIKKCTYDDFVINGKPLIMMENVNYHPEWWNHSNKILNMKINFTYGIGVTPCILYKNICGEIMDKYENILMSSPYSWTEYTIYYIYLTNFYNVQDLYENGIIYDKCLWSKEELNDAYNEEEVNNFINNSFKNNLGLFSLVQSNMYQTRTGLKIHKNIMQYVRNYIINNIIHN